jgi:hypothetical protein
VPSITAVPAIDNASAPVVPTVTAVPVAPVTPVVPVAAGIVAGPFSIALPPVPNFALDPPTGEPGKHYAVTKGKEVGVFPADNWSASFVLPFFVLPNYFNRLQVSPFVTGVSGAVYQRYDTEMIARQKYNQALQAGTVVEL